MRSLWVTWVAGAWTRLVVVWWMLAAVARVAGVGDGAGGWSLTGEVATAARWLPFAAPLALTWSWVAWCSAQGPLALGALGHRPGWAALALWVAVGAPVIGVPGPATADAAGLRFEAEALDWTPADGRGALHIRWSPEGARRGDDAHPHGTLPPPVVVPRRPAPPSAPFRLGALLVLALGLSRQGVAPTLAGGLLLAGLTGALSEGILWSIQP